MQALAATLDRDDAEPQAGDAVPPCWHWLYFLPLHRQSEIGPDGHPKRGGFLPPVPLPRRMWAGSRLEFRRPLRVGSAITRTSRIADVSGKEGRTGPLVFVRVRHEIVRRAAAWRIVDEHDIVYRDNPKPGRSRAAPRSRAPDDARMDARRSVPDDVLLFRYSALTFNGHRIHYDRTLRHRGRGLSGPDRARAADRDAAARPAAAQPARRDGHALRVPRRQAALRHRAVHGLRPPQRGRRQDRALWAQHADGALAMDATATLA